MQGFAQKKHLLLITSQLLYQLSYTGSTKVYYSGSNGDVNLILLSLGFFLSITSSSLFPMAANCP